MLNAISKQNSELVRYCRNYANEPGDILFLYTDGVYDGSDLEERKHLEVVMQENYSKSARDICNALLAHATKDDDYRRQIGEEDQIDEKTVFIIKRG